MISYLERHNVPWQIVVTKSDKVPAKQLAKRVTTMEDLQLTPSSDFKATPGAIAANANK